MGGPATDPTAAFNSDVIVGAPLTYTKGSLRDNLYSYINTAAWVKAPATRYGNPGRGMFRGPGQANLDCSLFKEFRLTEPP